MRRTNGLTKEERERGCRDLRRILDGGEELDLLLDRVSATELVELLQRHLNPEHRKQPLGVTREQREWEVHCQERVMGKVGEDLDRLLKDFSGPELLEFLRRHAVLPYRKRDESTEGEAQA